MCTNKAPVSSQVRAEAAALSSFLQPVMLPLLPNEIILDILELTAKSSKSAALNLCLLSSNIGRLIRPILYRKVVIMNGRQDMAFAWTLRNSSNFIYTRSLWIFTYLMDISQEDLDLLPTKLENLEDLACPAFLLTNRRICQLQDPGNTLMAFPHLKRLCIFHADDQSLLAIISVPITHLHLIRPTAKFINIILSNIPPSLHRVTSICLEAITPNIA